MSEFGGRVCRTPHVHHLLVTPDAVDAADSHDVESVIEFSGYFSDMEDVLVVAANESLSD
jgi:hypothetical protein